MRRDPGGPRLRLFLITPERTRRLQGWVQDIKERLSLLERFVRLNE
jgi:hypothetical protein